MNKRFLLLVFLFVSFNGISQLIINFQFPPSGLSFKGQLWNMMLINTSNSPLTIHIDVALSEVAGQQQILTGSTRSITLLPGANQVNAGVLSPIQYNNISNSYGIDNSPNGMLPLGSFEACYSFFRHVSDNVEQIAEQCIELAIQPLGPPQLVYPYDESSIQELQPLLTWLPPVPIAMFSNLKYDLTLTEVGPLQSASDAIQQNLPYYSGFDLSSNSLLYPMSAAPLEFGKKYAWRIVAKNNNAIVGNSETWQFTLKQFGTGVFKNAEAAFVKVRKAPETAYSIAVKELKFEYYNETEDTVWNITVYDLSDEDRAKINLDLDTIPLKRGQNLISFNLQNQAFFIHKHLYQIEIFNSRNETWRLRFQFREDNNID